MTQKARNAIVFGLLAAVALVVAVAIGRYREGQFAKRESQREQERVVLTAERDRLVRERDASLQAFSDEQRKNAVLVELADKQRGAINATAHEIQKVEGEQHDAAKQLLADQGALSDVDITHKLCVELRALGYKSLTKQCP